MRHKHLTESAVSGQCPNCVNHLKPSSRGLIERVFWPPPFSTRDEPTHNRPSFIMLYGRSMRGIHFGGNPWFAVLAACIRHQQASAKPKPNHGVHQDAHATRLTIDATRRTAFRVPQLRRCASA